MASKSINHRCLINILGLLVLQICFFNDLVGSAAYVKRRAGLKSYYKDLDSLVSDCLTQRIVKSLYKFATASNSNREGLSPHCLSQLKDRVLTCSQCVNQKCEERQKRKCTPNLYYPRINQNNEYDLNRHSFEKNRDNARARSRREEATENHHHSGARRTKRGLMDWLGSMWETVKGSVVKIMDGSSSAGKGIAQIGDGLEDVITPAYRAVRDLMTHVKQNGGILYNASSQLFTTYADCKGFQECYERSVDVMEEATGNLKDTDLAQTIKANLNKLKVEYDTIIKDIKKHPALQQINLQKGVILNESKEAMAQVLEGGKLARMEMGALGVAAMGFALDFLKVWTQCEGLENCQNELGQVFKKFEPDKISFLGTEVSGFLEEIKKMAIRVSALAFDSEIGKSIKRALKNMYNRGKSFLRKIFDFIKKLFVKNTHEDDDSQTLKEDKNGVDLKPAFKGIDQVMAEKIPESHYYSPYDTLETERNQHFFNTNDSLWEDELLYGFLDFPSDLTLQNSIAKANKQNKRFRRSPGSATIIKFRHSKLCQDGLVIKDDCTYKLGECVNYCDNLYNENCNFSNSSLELLLYEHGWMSSLFSPLYYTLKIKIEDEFEGPYITENKNNIKRLEYQAMGQFKTLTNVVLERPLQDIMDLAHIICDEIWDKELKIK